MFLEEYIGEIAFRDEIVVTTSSMNIWENRLMEMRAYSSQLYTASILAEENVINIIHSRYITTVCYPHN